MVILDASDVETTDSSLEAKRVYTITLRNMLPQASMPADIKVTKAGTAATITATKVMNSLMPLTGQYRVKCMNSLGEVSFTGYMNADANSFTVQWKINHECSKMYEKVVVWE